MTRNTAWGGGRRLLQAGEQLLVERGLAGDERFEFGAGGLRVGCCGLRVGCGSFGASGVGGGLRRDLRGLGGLRGGGFGLALVHGGGTGGGGCLPGGLLLHAGGAAAGGDGDGLVSHWPVPRGGTGRTSRPARPSRSA